MYGNRTAPTNAPFSLSRLGSGPRRMDFGRAEGVYGRNDIRSGDHRRSRFSPWRFDGLIGFRFCRTKATVTALPREGGIRNPHRLPRCGVSASNVPEEARMRNGNSSSKAVRWFAIELPISYEGPEGSLLQGNGLTLAMSSGAIQFACDRNLPVGHVFRLWIQWPATLCDGTGLSLWATGTIQRSECCEVEVAVKRHEFRTRRAGGSKPSIMFNAVARSAR